jgi:hypothetical protein
MRRRNPIVALALCALVVPAILGCDAASTHVVVDNRYPPSSGLVIYRAFWQAVSFTNPIAPGSSSDRQSTIAASENPAWVLLAPGWDRASADPPPSLVVLESQRGFAVHLDQTLHIPVDDVVFDGNCATGSRLAQDQADFITGRVFASVFAGRHYDAASCTTTDAP